MSHKWTREVGLREIDAIIGSNGRAQHPTQLPKAVLRVLSMVNAEDRAPVMEKFLREFSPLLPGDVGTYDFPEPSERMPRMHKSYMCVLFQAGASTSSHREIAENIVKAIDARSGSDQLALVMTLAHGAIAIDHVGTTVLYILRKRMMRDLNCGKCTSGIDCDMN